MSDEEDEKVEVVVAGHGGLRVDSLTGQRKGGRKTNAEWNAKEPPPKGQLSFTAFAAHTQNKKPKMMATEGGAMEVGGVEMTTFSSTITTNTSTSGRTPASAIATLPVTSSSGSTSKRQRGIGGDGVGGYHHEVLLPPSKDAAKGASGVEALSGAVEHIAAAVASKVETSVGEVVDRATVRTKTLERSGILDDLFDSLMFCTFNMPNIHEIDFEALMREWESEGHKLGTFKGVDGDSAESSSKVIKRMLKEKSPTFLFKGPPEN